MTNTMIQGIALDAAARDIAAMIPHRCPNFLATLNAAIDDYFDNPDMTLTPGDRLTIGDAVIDLKF